MRTEKAFMKLTEDAFRCNLQISKGYINDIATSLRTQDVNFLSDRKVALRSRKGFELRKDSL
jgi:hypothetical protein